MNLPLRRSQTHRVKLKLLSLATAILFATGLQSQVHRTGSAGPSLSGRTINDSGQPVKDAVVTLATPQNGSQRTTTSDTDGRYEFRNLSTGVDYELKAEHEGLASSVTVFRTSDAGEKVTVPLRVTAQIRFEDKTKAAGLNFHVRNGAAGQFFLPEIMTGGVAAFDFDNDGCTDVFFANGAELPSMEKSGAEFFNRLYRNQCDGTFKDITTSAHVSGKGYSMGAATGDYDNDGHLDLFVTGLNQNTLYRNRGDGTFEDVTASAQLKRDGRAGKIWSVSAGWFDYDNDGGADLFVVNYVVWDPRSAPVCGTPEHRFYCHPRSFAGSANQLFHNNRDGTFTDVSDAAGISRSVGKGMGVAFGDLDGDGRVDVFVANDSMANFLFRNKGDGTFKEIGLEVGVAYTGHGNAVAGMGADFRDYNEDGRDDIVLTAMYYDTFPLFRNRGKPGFFLDETAESGVFKATKELTGWGVGMYDFDNDGNKDLFFASSHFPQTHRNNPSLRSDSGLPNHVLRNGGRNWFEDVSAAAGPDFQVSSFYHGAAFADFDNDGRIDIVVSALNAPARLFRNVSPGPAHWIAFRLNGTASNKHGLGARVRVVLPTGRLLFNRVSTSVGYASASEPIVRFGLGVHEIVKEVRIEWPSGQVQTLSNVKADGVFAVTEPS